jgi:hypothetical protein
MDFNDQTPRRNVTISGVQFSVPEPIAEGHKVNENEAAALNQVLAENVRNNFANRVKKAQEAGEDPSALQAELDQYVGEYEFGVRRGGGGGATSSKDPVEKEAEALAKAKVKEALKSKGHKISDVSSEKISELTKNALEKYPEFREQAKQIVEARQSVGSELMEDVS